MYLKTWEEFERAAEALYLQDSMRARYSMKYSHSDGFVTVKMTDDKTCLQYKTEIHQELKRIDKFMGNLLKHMATT